MSLAMSANVGTLLASGQQRLDRAGVDGARQEARLLLAAAMDRSWGDLVGREDQPVAADQAMRFESFIARRAEREPVSRILGRREFWSLDFGLSAATLDPRLLHGNQIDRALLTPTFSPHRRSASHQRVSRCCGSDRHYARCVFVVRRPDGRARFRPVPAGRRRRGQ